jgi:hypothetical protein
VLPCGVPLLLLFKLTKDFCFGLQIVTIQFLQVKDNMTEEKAFSKFCKATGLSESETNLHLDFIAMYREGVEFCRNSVTNPEMFTLDEMIDNYLSPNTSLYLLPHWIASLRLHCVWAMSLRLIHEWHREKLEKSLELNKIRC